MALPRDLGGPVRTYRLFLSHAWDYDDDYDRLESLLNNCPGFYWRNLSVPSHDRIHGLSDGNAIRGALTHYIHRAECLIICAGMYCAHRDWIQAEMDIAKDLSKPILGVELWGQQRTPIEVQDAADKMVGWSTDSIVGAVRELCPAVVPRLLHLGFTAYTPVLWAQIDAVVASLSLDWCRYASHCYLVWTTLPAQILCEQIRATPGLGNVYVVACALQIEDGYGILPNFLWDWLRRYDYT